MGILSWFNNSVIFAAHLAENFIDTIVIAARCRIPLA